MFLLWSYIRDVKQVVNTSSQNSSIRCGNSFTGHMTSGTSFSAESSLRQESSFRGSAQADAPRVPSGGRFQAPVALALKESMSAESSVLSSSAHASNESSFNSSSGRRGRNTSRSGWVGDRLKWLVYFLEKTFCSPFNGHILYFAP